MKRIWFLAALLLLVCLIGATAAQNDWLSDGVAYYHSTGGNSWVSAYDSRVASGYEPSTIYYSYSLANKNTTYLFNGYGMPKGYFDRSENFYHYYNQYGAGYNADPWFTQIAIPFLRDNYHYQLSAANVGYLRQPYWNGPLQDWFGYRALSSWKTNQIQHDAFYQNNVLTLIQNTPPGGIVNIP